MTRPADRRIPVVASRPTPTTCEDTALFPLQVLDASMAPEFPEGCVVVVDPGVPPADGSFVVAGTADGMLLRRLVHENGNWWLETLEPGAARLAVLTAAVRGTVTQRTGRRRRDRKHYPPAAQ